MARILVVDDDPDGSEVICKFLLRAGHQAVCLPNGRKALASLATVDPDLVILDLLMPEMNGAQFLEILRNYSRGATLPIIVLTALSEGPLLKQIREMGVARVLHKTGFKLSALVGCIEELVGSRSVTGMPPPDSLVQPAHLQ